jgi:hypothetical protein
LLTENRVLRCLEARTRCAIAMVSAVVIRMGEIEWLGMVTEGKLEVIF